MFLKTVWPAGRLTLLLFVPLILTANLTLAQEVFTDTVRVVNTAIAPGDTNDVFIHISNSERLGGYTLRMIYDTSKIEAVTLADNSTLFATQWRGNFLIFNFHLKEPGLIQGVATFLDFDGLESGSGNTIRLRFYAREYAPNETSTPIDFVDDPSLPDSWNWFAAFDGLSQYQPVKVSGSIYVGCDCPDYGDCNEDGVINPQDVVLIRDFVYKDFYSPLPRAASCPHQTGDVNCDGTVNPVYVVLYIAYVYQDLTLWPCENPCSE